MATAPMTVRICYLYPRLLSVAGDRGNLLALIRRCSWRGFRDSVTEADVGEFPDFTLADLILIHCCQGCEVNAAARCLAALRCALRSAVEAVSGVLVLPS